MGSDGPGRNAATDTGGFNGSEQPGDAGPGSEAGHVDLTRPDAYGRAFADVYDRWYPAGPPGPPGEAPEATVEAMVSFVAERCRSGTVVELGAGSGRLAVPLRRVGLSVIGLDASVDMLRRCPSTVLRVAGDMAHLPFHIPVSGRSPGPVVLCGFNTLFNVGAPDRLDRLLGSLVELGATFIVEMANIDPLVRQPMRSTAPAPFTVDGGVVVSATAGDPDGKQLAGRHLEITDHGVISRPWLLRLVGHDELDAAAERHGLTLVERYRSWWTEPHTAGDPASISVYR